MALLSRTKTKKKLNWKIKAALQIILSKTKMGDKINHLHAKLQSNYNKNVCNYQFYECLRKYKLIPKPVSKEYALEIGTGYSLISPITLYLLGYKKIITVDITEDLDFKTVKKQLKFLLDETILNELSKECKKPKEGIKQKIKNLLTCINLKQLLLKANITYIPEYTFKDIESLNLQFDYIYSQVVLEHIKPKILQELFKKTGVWLTKNGYSIHTINFIDHFANTGFFEDKSISLFNFLKYSDKFWLFWAGNSIAYTNRLSYMYYFELCDLNSLKVLNFIGENYRENRLNKELKIHPDILNHYKNTYKISDFTKYQRGTLLFKKE